jgi:cytochrome P450
MVDADLHVSERIKSASVRVIPASARDSYRRIMSLHSTLPRPTPLPLKAVPRLFRNAGHDMVPALNVLFDETGSPARINVPGVVDLVLVDRPQDVEQIFLRKQDVYVKGEEYDVPALGLRRGLVTSRGDRWKRDRAMLTPMFARRHLEVFTNSMVDQANLMLDGWAAHPDGARVDVAHEMMVVALQIAAETMFGTHLSDDEVATVGEGLSQVLEDMLRVGNSPFTWLLQALPGMNVASAASAHWRSRRIAHRLHELDAMITKRIEQRDPDDQPTDFLGLVLAARDQATGQRLSRAEVLEQSATFLAAGHETTATAMAWFWHLLSQNPDARSRMLDEVDSVLQGRSPTYDDFDRLPWTRACFSEAMRIHPPVYLSMRRATADDDLNGYHIKRGTIMVVLTHRLHRNPDFWPEPDRFDPNRFLAGGDAGRPKSAYAPFGGGRRICIGLQFALLEATMLAAATSQRYVLDAAPGHRVVEEGFTTLRPKGGLPMVIRRRA